ncbi:HupE/UreJ family protein [Paraflavisolibacter sp. H34]|uniref:HupE/UreJ family protein n=1 Tax=Huijunlia imazamoxiresistens TaxID=3127457 RepID=UPI003018BDD7
MTDFGFYLALGWEHIMTPGALDHILFIIVLTAIYLPKDWKQVLVLVTAFTIGHSLTLALSTLNLVELPAKWVEFVIPCTIVITAVSNLFRKSTSTVAARQQYGMALLFGLVHGLGFANTLRFILAADQKLGWALLGFNLGLELGQIVIVGVALFLSYVFIHRLRIQRREWVLFISAGVFSLALEMAVTRI